MGDIWIEHYCSSHQILLVGEGNFSFSLSLARAFGSAVNMVATSLDSEAEVVNNYSAGRTILEELKLRGCRVVHGVDATTMGIRQDAEGFDRIVFNFPHAGFANREDNLDQIMLHKNLVLNFLNQAREMLNEDGEIHVTHKTSIPYILWGIRRLAMQVGLGLKEEVTFNCYSYPYYQNKRGADSRSSTMDESFPIGDASTFKFVKI